MATASDLDLGHFCLTAASPAERFDAAACAGFTGISLFWGEVGAGREAQGGVAHLRRALADADLRPALMEYIPLPRGEEIHAFPAEARDIADTSAELGCELVQAVALGPGAPFADLAEGLGLLAEACRAAGLGCVLEFVPFITSVPSLAEALALLRAVDSPALGLLIDSFHFFRSGAPWRELEALRPGQVRCIQVNDGPARRPCADYGQECMALRRLPGDGAFDLARFVRTLATVAPDVPLMAEVVNDGLLGLPAAQAAEMIAARTRPLRGIALGAASGN
jgi:sugar phosphate isomerase/epimerase